MKTKVLFSIAIIGVTAICSGAGGAAGVTIVGPLRAPTSATPEPTTSQTPGQTMTTPVTAAPVKPTDNPNTPGAVNGNGNFNNGFANTNSLYSTIYPPGQPNRPFGNPPGGAIMPPQPGVNLQLRSGNSAPRVNSTLPATIAPSPGANVPATIVPPPAANSTSIIMPPSRASLPQLPVKTSSLGTNSTPPNP